MQGINYCWCLLSLEDMWKCLVVSDLISSKTPKNIRKITAMTILGSVERRRKHCEIVSLLVLVIA